MLRFLSKGAPKALLTAIKTQIVLAAGTAIIGKVGIDQTTPGTTNGVQVVAALPAGTALIGKVGIDQTTPGTTNKVQAGATVTVSSTPTLSAPGAYVTGDYVGTTTSPASFGSVVPVSGGSCVLESVTITDKVATTPSVAFELWLFDRTFTAPTDNVAWAISDADQLNCLAVIPIAAGDWYPNGNGNVASVGGIGKVLTCNATSIFYGLVIRGGRTFADGDLTLKLGVLQD